MSLLVFLLTLSVLVFVHEFAHFLVAKRSGVDVEEFGFGLPPRIMGKKFKGTLYSLNLLPIGGFVKLKGETGEVLGFGDRNSFAAASKKSRALIVLAGVLGNLLLAYLIFILLFIIGNPRLSGKTTIEAVSDGSPAEAVGLKSGDVINNAAGEEVEAASRLIEIINRYKGSAVTIGVTRGGEKLSFTVTPRVNPPENEGPLGVRLGFKGGIVYERTGPLKAPIRALTEIGNMLGVMVSTLGQTVQTLLSAQVPQGLTGVVGIYKLTEEASQVGLRVYLQFVALLSLNLFLFNLLPIPALDGGRFLFISVETVLRRPVPARAENLANNLGLAFLLLIFVLITLSDLKRFWG